MTAREEIIILGIATIIGGACFLFFRLLGF